ncbi:MAG: EthD domain-containing protein [Actinomycetota bacterium]
MTKPVYCVRKRSDLTDEEFHDYWLNQHGPLVVRLAPVMQLKRYVQSHTMTLDLHEIVKATRALKDHYDGLAELWREDIDTFIGAYSSPEGMDADAALREDEAKFIDFSDWFPCPAGNGSRALRAWISPRRPRPHAQFQYKKSPEEPP